MDVDDDEDDDDDDDEESELDNNDGEDDTISLLEPEVVVPKETRIKRKKKDGVLMNVVGLESFAVENTQPLRRSSRPPKATEEVIGLENGKTLALSTFVKK